MVAYKLALRFFFLLIGLVCVCVCVGEVEGEPPSKRLKKNNGVEQYSFNLKHGSLLLMRGNTQRDWLHSVPKRLKAGSTRVNLTFRRVV